jgi:hypothetical protein
VRAVNAGGEAVSNTQYLSTNACGAPPAPTGLETVSYSAYWMQVSWDDVLDDEESYRIERSYTQYGSYSIVGYTEEDEVVFIDTNAIDLDGEQPVVLWYRVVSVNSYGSNTSTAVRGVNYSQFFPYMQFTP